MINKVLLPEKSGFHWLDIIDPSHAELKEVAAEFGLHPTSLEDCLDPRHQPKFERIGNVKFIILRAYDDCCDEREDNVQKITRKVAIFEGDNFIITVHRRDLDFMRELRDEWSAKPKFSEVDQTLLLFDIINGAVLSYVPALDRLEATVDELERRIFSPKNQAAVIIQDVYWFRTRVSTIRRVFTQSYNAVLRMDDYTEHIAPLYQDVRERLERYIATTDELRETSSDLLNTQLSIASHHTNEVIRVLTIFSVFFLPLTFIVGVYGMNFYHMPELRWLYGYPATLGVMVAVVLVIFVWFKRSGWLK